MPGTRAGLAYIHQVNPHVFRGSHVCGYQVAIKLYRISVNSVVESFIHSKFSEWYAEQVTELFYNDDDNPVDLSTTRMKCLGAQWMVALYEHLTDNPYIIVNGF